MDAKQKALSLHRQWQGKIEIALRAPLSSKEDLTMAYTPGVAEPCLVIKENPADSYTYTRRGNVVAVITDGSAVLGLGNIGPLAAMPVMEGKCALFKKFANVDAIPLCIDTQDVDAFVDTVARLQPSFGGINLEDIAAPRCFEIERRLKDMCEIPVFHDDQHGTAIVAGAALLNGLRLTHKAVDRIRVVISGSGAAGIAVARIFLALGVTDILMFNVDGILVEGKPSLNGPEAAMAEITNLDRRNCTMAEAMVGADVFLGVSAPNIVTKEMVAGMAKDAMVFAMANPVPEILPADAKAAGARIVGSGRSDYPNQINNLLAFPGIFRGALDIRAGDINEAMKLAAARAIAELVPTEALSPDYIIPDAVDPRVAPAVAVAVAQAARLSGVAGV
ncbi:NAD-dependent malic enzyme [Eubacteriales bacterium OttesenSCG-928-M02]|nr:NAD-dependent malic enzyme [Eubacteriales bacterium OttesenSCG-928-M02]